MGIRDNNNADTYFNVSIVWCTECMYNCNRLFYSVSAVRVSRKEHDVQVRSTCGNSLFQPGFHGFQCWLLVYSVYNTGFRCGSCCSWHCTILRSTSVSAAAAAAASRCGQCRTAAAGDCTTCPVVRWTHHLRVPRLLALQLALWTRRFHLGRLVYTIQQNIQEKWLRKLQNAKGIIKRSAILFARYITYVNGFFLQLTKQMHKSAELHDDKQNTEYTSDFRPNTVGLPTVQDSPGQSRIGSQCPMFRAR